VNRIVETAIPIAQVFLALLFAFSGLAKLILPYARFVRLPAQAWANDFQPPIVRLIGIVEVCASIGMVIPLLSNSFTPLTPLAGIGMALFMAGAMATHLRRAEYPNMVGNFVWIGLALIVAYDGLVRAVA